MTATSNERASARPRSTWGLADVAVGWLAGQVLALVAFSAIASATGRSSTEMEELPIGLVLLGQVGLWVGLLTIVVVATTLKGAGPRVELRLRAEPRDLPIGGLLGALLQVPVLPILYWPILRLLDKSGGDLEEAAREIVDKVHGVPGVLALVVMVVICAPVVEEIFYRGFLQGALLKRGLPPAVAIGISSVTFGLVHFQLLQLPALVLVGVVTGVLAHRYQRLGPAIAAHMAFNLVSTIVLLSN